MSDEQQITETNKKSQKYTQKTDQEIRQLALDMADGRVFLTTDPHEIKLSFGMILIFLTGEYLRNLEQRDIVAFYEYISDALPQSVNGLPMFMSASTLTRDEFNRLCDAHEEVKAFREKFVGSTEKNP